MPKRDLDFGKPLMNAAGTLGFAPDQRAPAPWDDFGAFVTNPISLRPRRPAARPGLIEFPGGFLLHSGMPNPGMPAVIKKYAHTWAEHTRPVIVNLMADRPEETRRMVRVLERQENVMAAELGFAPLLADDIIFLALEMCRGELPLIVGLPDDQLLRLGHRVIQEGAAAVTLAAPRGMLPIALPPGAAPAANASQSHGPEQPEMVSGRLFGPSLFPRSLDQVHAAARLGLPVIGAGGVYSMADAAAMLAAGALAVQLDAGLWLPWV
jgi:dihydroorotate dehydrogenase